MSWVAALTITLALAATAPGDQKTPAEPPPAEKKAPAKKQPAKERLYRVRGNGEMLFEITRQVLGDPRRWPEIFWLNPDIRPELTIPGGTLLRMPPGGMWQD